MGCGCGSGRGIRNAARNRRPVIGPRPAPNRGVAAGPAPIQAAALARQAAKSGSGMSKQRRQMERKRRATIARRTLGK